MEPFLKSIGDVSQSVYSFIAFIFLIFIWAYVVTKGKKLKIVASVIRDLPEADRKAVILRDFDTTPKEGITAQEWIKAQKHKYYFIGFISTLIAIVIIFIIYLTNKGNRREAHLSLVDITVNSTDSFPELDIKVRNNSDDVVFLKKIDVTTLGRWVIENPSMEAEFIESSWMYDVSLPEVIGKKLSFELSQEVKPNSVDRFKIRIKGNGEAIFGVTPFLFASNLIYNENNSSIPLPKILLNIPAEGELIASYNGGMDDKKLKQYYSEIKRTCSEIKSKIDSSVKVEHKLSEVLSEIDKIDTTKI